MSIRLDHYKRRRNGIVLIDQDKCRGWRMCACPYKKIYFNWKSGKAEKCIFYYLRIEVGQPMCSETCVGRIRYLGVLLYDADRIEAAASVETTRICTRRSSICSSIRTIRRSSNRRARTVSPEAWLEGARNSPGVQDGDGLEGGAAAASRISHAADGVVRAALSPITAAANAGQIGGRKRLDSRRQGTAHLVNYLANLLTAGDTKPVVRRSSACWRCAPTSATNTSSGREPRSARAHRQLSVAQVEEMYRIMAIANYEDRFVIPSTHREYAENTFDLRGGCGFSFGNGCSGRYQRHESVRCDQKRTIPIKAEV